MSEIFGIPVAGVQDLAGAFLTSLLLALFAVVVGALARFRGAAGAYAYFGIMFAIATTAGNLRNIIRNGLHGDLVADPDWSLLEPRAAVALTIVLVLYGIAGAGFAHSILRLLRHYNVTTMLRSWVTWFMFALWILTFMRSPGVLIPSADAAGMWLTAIATVATLLAVFPFALMAAAPVELARAAVRDPRSGQPILAAALGAYGWFVSVGIAAIWMRLTGGFDLTAAEPALQATAAWLAACIAWWWAAEQTGNKLFQRIPLFASAAMLAGALIAFADLMWLDPAAVARTSEILLVGYAILRHQYLDLDIKVRWGISKSTVAALFIAIFFIVSEGAAAMFSERWGTEIGIIAAGALVFGIAPIMRWADRFAAGAVPLPQGNEAEGVFRSSLRVALKDGIIDPAEEDALAEQADRLGISAGRMLQLRREVET